MPAVPPLKRQATPVELAALLMDAACRSSVAEESALREFAEFFKLDLHGMLTELMFLRAFSVDFAIAITLSDGPEKERILARYYHHWEMLGNTSGDDFTNELQERLQYYLAATDSLRIDSSGLTAQVGYAFANRTVGSGEWRDDLAMLGGSMFVALFDEVTALLQDVEIVALEP